MFRYLYNIVFLFFGASLVYSQNDLPILSNDKNWSSTVSYDLSGKVIGKGVSFYNVLGNGTQSQSWDILTNRVWATEVRYDSFGRAVLQTLSAPVKNNGIFEYKENFVLSNNMPLTLQDYDAPATIYNPPVITNTVIHTLGWYYSNLNNLDPYQDITSYPYTRTIFSTLNPGAVKAVLGGNKINGNWLQSYSFSMPIEKRTSNSDYFYSTLKDSKVIKTITRDVHGVESVVFEDTDGNVLGAARSGSGTQREVYSEILDKGFVDIHIPEGCGGNVLFSNLIANHQIRIYDLITEMDITSSLSATPISGSNNSIFFAPGFYRIEEVTKEYLNNHTTTFIPIPVKITYKVNYYDLSKNEYDYNGRLLKATQPLTTDSGAELSTTFEYNSFGELLKTTSPDEGTSKFKYRRDGQIRFSQNAEQAKKYAFSYTNYDVLGRPIESGVYEGKEILFEASNASNVSEITVDSIVEELDGLPINGRSEQNFTVYDLPDPDLETKLVNCSIPSTEYKQSFVSGNVSYTYTQNPTTNKTWYSYDVSGRLEWMIQETEGLDCLKTINYQFDPATEQLSTVTYQKNTEAEVFVHKYDYNAAGQLVEVSTSTNRIDFTKQAHYYYNESGALTRTELANNLQGIDYVYNLNGQLKAINHPSLLAANDPGNDGANGFASDVFGMSLDYYTGDYTRNNTPKPIATTTTAATEQYNGNIKATRWNTQVAAPEQKAYTYQYNKNNWLTQATFGAMNNSGVFTPSNTNDYREGNITYDANGNIKSLTRNGYTDASGNNLMDNFQYVYQTDKPNRLSYIKDTEDNAVANRYKDIKNQEKSISYGNYTFNGFGITEKLPNYLYNDLGQMTFNVQDNVGYQYNASGLVTAITTGASNNTDNFIALFNNAYVDPSVSHLESKKWSMSGVTQITPVINLLCDDSETTYTQGNALRILGTQVISTKLRVLPNTFTKVNLDVIVDKYLYNAFALEGENSLAIDIVPQVNIRLKRSNGQLIPGSQQVITNQPAIYCNQLFESAVSIGYNNGADEFITLEIETIQVQPPTDPEASSYQQRIFVDNLQVLAAQDTKVAFYYNDRGHRVRKESYGANYYTATTYYVNDASGNTIAVYTANSSRTGQLKLAENTVFGSGRVGVFKRDNTLTEKGYTLYELTDHLGNVRAVIRKVGLNVVSLTNKTDYYPFGMPMPNQQITDGNYRYAFQGQEKDAETGMEAFELRLWDGRLGRWLTVDPMGQYFSPYLGMGNNPISRIDPDGGADDWHKDGNGNLVADAGDNAYTLAEYLNTTPEIALGILNNQGYKTNSKGVLNLKINDVVKVEYHSPVTDDVRQDLNNPISHNARYFAGSNFSKDLFERYLDGDGDLNLSPERFTGLLMFLKESKPKVTSVNKVDKNVTAKITSFYSSKEYDKAFGSATVYYNKQNNVIGFYDKYDFNPIDFKKTHRSLKNEIITRMVYYSSSTDAKSFEIHYGYHKK